MSLVVTLDVPTCSKWYIKLFLLLSLECEIGRKQQNCGQKVESDLTSYRVTS